jgi:hypothetical protein
MRRLAAGLAWSAVLWATIAPTVLLLVAAGLGLTTADARWVDASSALERAQRSLAADRFVTSTLALAVVFAPPGPAVAPLRARNAPPVRGRAPSHGSDANRRI